MTLVGALGCWVITLGMAVVVLLSAGADFFMAAANGFVGSRAQARWSVLTSTAYCVFLFSFGVSILYSIIGLWVWVT